MKLPLTNFVRDILCHFKVALSQLSARAWRTVLGFESLRVSFAPNSCRREDFCAIYFIRKTNQDGHFFIPQGGCDKLIVNLVDSDHGWRDIIIWVSGCWEATATKSCVLVSTSWNRGPISQGSASVSEEVQERCGGCSRLITIFATGVGCWI